MKKRRKNCKASNKYKIFLDDRVKITKGRMAGETGTVIGETNLNMNHLVAVRRDNLNARKGIVWLRQSGVTLI
jgi:ribosomal protein L24